MTAADRGRTGGRRSVCGLKIDRRLIVSDLSNLFLRNGFGWERGENRVRRENPGWLRESFTGVLTASGSVQTPAFATGFTPVN